MDPKQNKIITAKIEQWKRALLSTGANAAMINLKETLKTLLITYPEDISSLYSDLILNGTTFEFPLQSITSKPDIDDTFNPSEDFSEYKQQPPFFPDTYEPTIHNNKVIFGCSKKWKTTDKLKELQKSLRSIRSNAKTYSEETGLHNLYLVFGILNWYEVENSSTLRRSPLLLVPLDITKSSINEPFLISRNDDDIIVNPTLEYRLGQDFNMLLPSFQEESNLTDFFDQLEDKIKLCANWSVEHVCYLTTLSFQKLIIYKDIEENSELIANHDIIGQFTGISVDNSYESSESYFNHDEENPSNNYQVLDADSSQLDAISLAKKGRSFVLQGPPGTGKSQTITNIISEMLGLGKKVLFVSEKMAALEVVASRLEKVGLKDYCLKLHSPKGASGRKDIVEQLYHSLTMEKIEENKETLDTFFYSLRDSRQKLLTYAENIHSVINPLGKTLFQVQGILVALNDTPVVLLDLQRISEISSEKLRIAESQLSRLAVLKKELLSFGKRNPWEGHNCPQITLEVQNKIALWGNQLLSDFELYKVLVSDIQTKTGLVSIKTIQQTLDYFPLFKELAEAKTIKQNRLQLQNKKEIQNSMKN
jgi:hypothetical protein